MNRIEPEPLMTLPEVCRYIRADRRTVLRLVKAGFLKATKIFACWRFRRDDVEAFLVSR